MRAAAPRGALLAQAARAPRIKLAELAPPWGGLLLVIPHPDDETLGCGMALAAAAHARRSIGIIMVTDGEGSHPRSIAFPPSKLAALRRREYRTALHELVGPSDVPTLRLKLSDGRTTEKSISPEVYGETVRFARTLQPSSVWTTWSGDPHCDHRTAARLGATIASQCKAMQWSFAVWGRFGPKTKPQKKLYRFHAPSFAGRKRAAMRAYKSQLTRLIPDDPTGFVMPPRYVRHFSEHPEIFLNER